MLYAIDTVQKSHEPNAMQVVNSLAGAGFSGVLEAVTGKNEVIEELEALGVNVTVRAIPNNPEMVRSHANSVSSFGSVTIAPNILEDMANDSDVRQKFVNKIGNWISGKPDHIARVNALGGRVVHMSMVIHPDGTVTYNSATVYDPVEDEDDDKYKAVKTENVNYYDKLDDEGTGQHLIAESLPLDVNGHLMAHQFVSLIPHDIEPSRSRHRIALARYQAETLSLDRTANDTRRLIDSKMASVMLSDSVLKQYQRTFK